MAIRAASTWRAVSQPGSRAWIPKSPNATDAPPLAWPESRLRCVLRCLTFLGINISVRLLAEVRGLVVLVPVLALHLLVLGQLAIEVVGLRRRGQQVGRGRLRLSLCVLLRLHRGGRCGSGSDIGRLRGLGDGLLQRGLGLDGLFLDLACAVLVSGESLGAAAAATGGDEPTRATLAGRLAHGHGGLAGDFVLARDLVGENVALVDPHLHPDAARRGAGLAEAVVDVGTQRVQRDAALAVLLLAGHLRAAEAARALDLDALRPGLLHGLDGALHGAAEGDPPNELVTDALGDQRGVELGLLDLLNVELNPVLQTRELLEVLLQAVGLGAAAADDDAGGGGVDVDAQAVARALHLNPTDGRSLELPHQIVADLPVL